MIIYYRNILLYKNNIKLNLDQWKYINCIINVCEKGYTATPGSVKAAFLQRNMSWLESNSVNARRVDHPRPQHHTCTHRTQRRTSSSLTHSKMFRFSSHVYLPQILCLGLYLLTYSLEQNPSWEANWFSASQEIPRTLWDPKVHYHIHKCPPPILSQLDPVHTPHPTSFRSILILSSHLHLGFPSGLFPSGLPNKTLHTPLLSPIRATCPTHLILLDCIAQTVLGEQYRSLSYSLCSFWTLEVNIFLHLF
jgi:hypothetical protein